MKAGRRNEGRLNGAAAVILAAADALRHAAHAAALQRHNLAGSCRRQAGRAHRHPRLRSWRRRRASRAHLKTEASAVPSTYTTSGVWVLLEAAAEASRESLTLTSAEWRGPSGVRYTLSQRFSTMPGMLPAERLEPGLPKPVLMAFEVPESELAGGTLLVAPSAFYAAWRRGPGGDHATRAGQYPKRRDDSPDRRADALGLGGGVMAKANSQSERRRYWMSLAGLAIALPVAVLVHSWESIAAWRAVNEHDPVMVGREESRELRRGRMAADGTVAAAKRLCRAGRGAGRIRGEDRGA